MKSEIKDGSAELPLFLIDSELHKIVEKLKPELKDISSRQGEQELYQIPLF